jgi:ParB family chromosome partitioning protein
MKPKRLGRGLLGLITKTEPSAPAAEASAPAALAPLGGRLGTPAQTPPQSPGLAAPHVPAPGGAVPRALAVGAIRPNPFQPRTTFDEAALQELADSIRAHGVLQPIVVRPSLGGYEVLAGERRLRAAKAAGLTQIPAVVREATDEEMQTLALVENIQREDLNAMEKARALKAMLGNFGLTQEQVAARVGKARTTIANILRLLELPSEIQQWVEEGKLSGAHARALLLAKSPARRLELGRLAATFGLSVREIERRAAGDGATPAGGGPGKRNDPFVQDLAKRLERALATNVRVVPRGKGGRIEVRYHDAADLDRLLDLMGA